VVVSIKITFELFSETLQQVIHIILQEGFVRFSLLKVRSSCRPICHSVSARAWCCSLLLKIIPVLNNLSIFKTEYIKANQRNVWDAKLRMRKYEIPILKRSKRIDFKRDFLINCSTLD